MESIGVKIQVDGGKEFKTQLDNIKATSKELSAELKNVVNGLDSTGNKQQDTAKKVQLLVSAYDNAGKKLETLTAEYMGNMGTTVTGYYGVAMMQSRFLRRLVITCCST